MSDQSWRGRGSVFFVGIQAVSARRVRKELIIYNLYLFARPLRVDYGWPFVNDAKFKKYRYSHSTKYICTQGIILHPATVYLCSFKELYLFNCQGNNLTLFHLGFFKVAQLWGVGGGGGKCPRSITLKLLMIMR